jgi:tetratricopeptide (TPR) repeat protein
MVDRAMPIKWLDAREATAVGNALADDLELRTEAASPAKHRNDAGAEPSAKDLRRFLPRFFQRVDREALPLRLNVFQRAKLANTFKWRLLEKGVAQDLVEELTRALVQRLNPTPAAALKADKPMAHSPRRAAGEVQILLAKGDACMAKGAWAEAVGYYEELLSIDSRHATARNNLGAALCRVGRYADAEDQFRGAIGLNTRMPDAHNNLGTVLRWRGRAIESEQPLRRALKLKPSYVDAQSSLGLTLVLLARLQEAKECFEKALRVAPRNTDALAGLAQIAGLEGRFSEAESLYKRVLEIDPKMPGAWSALAQLHKMSSGDGAWLKGAEEVAASGLTPLDEANVRFAIGKYHDDLGTYGRAFRSYERANELQKTVAVDYDRGARSRFVDELIRVYTPDTFSRPHQGASDSERPVFVVGMMRSGTTLVEQIIASHPAAKGAGELEFWSDFVRKHEFARHKLFDEALRKKASAAYMRILGSRSSDALRVVDKTTFNADYLGIIHSVFPKARIIYLRRDPIDTCLSCYFQQLYPTLNFSMDLSDLAHFYKEHHRLVAHWRTVLPSHALLDVPYAELITDQETWTRKIVDFLGLEWDERCLDFDKTQRPVVTASFWQVRQKIYKSSVGRWRNYEKFVGPLLGLRGLDG